MNDFPYESYKKDMKSQGRESEILSPEKFRLSPERRIQKIKNFGSCYMIPFFKLMKGLK